MNPEKLFTVEDAKTLQAAHETYGAHKQIGVAAEECTELAKELIKAFRYDDFEDAVKNTKENVVDEVADVLIVLDHILNLYSITTSDLQPHITKKLDRLRYWLAHSKNTEFTTQHRSLSAADQAEAEAFNKYQQKFYKDMAEQESGETFKVKPTDTKGVYEFEGLGVMWVDSNDSKYREG